VTRVFFDANLLFTACHRPQGKAATLIRHAKAAGCVCLYSDLVLQEVVRNLERKQPSSLEELPNLLGHMERVQGQADRPCPVHLPEKDQHVLLAAMAGRADVLVTGDLKDFGPFMNKPRQTGGVLIQTLAQFMDQEFKEPLR
jgi:uncharacterized protein